MTAPAGGNHQLRRLAVLIAIAFVDMVGFMLVLPLLPFYALKLHAEPFQIGLIYSAFSIAQILSAPVWGRVSDRYGRRPALLVGLLASAAAYLVFGFADSLWLLFASRFVQGAGEHAHRSVGPSHVESIGDHGVSGAAAHEPADRAALRISLLRFLV